MNRQPFPGVKPDPATITPAEAVSAAYREGQRVGRALALNNLRRQLLACSTLEDARGLIECQLAGVPVAVRRLGVARAA